VQLKTALPDGAQKKFSDRDELYESAIDIVVREGRGSVSLLQRALGIGYGRAARLIDFMAEDGIVGPYNGSQAREILMSLERWQQITGQGDGGSGNAQNVSAKTSRSGKIVLSPGKIVDVKPVDRNEDAAESDDFDDEEDDPPFDEDAAGEDEEEFLEDENDAEEIDQEEDEESRADAMDDADASDDANPAECRRLSRRSAG